MIKVLSISGVKNNENVLNENWLSGSYKHVLSQANGRLRRFKKKKKSKSRQHPVMNIIILKRSAGFKKGGSKEKVKN